MVRIPIAIVGLNFGKHVLNSQFSTRAGEGSALPHMELKAVCSQEREKTEKLAGEFNVAAAHDLDALLKDPSITAIGLFTGPVRRAELIRQCIRAGKHVMTTKPFETDPDAALDVLTEAQRLGRIVHLNSPNPTPPPDLAQIARWRSEHDLGQPLACRAEVWVRYREKPDGSWYDDPAQCPAAPIFRLGIYLINDLAGIFGPAEQAHVMQSRLFTQRPTSDHAQLSIRYASGALAHVFASFCIADGEHYKNTLTLNFERGTIYRNAGPRSSHEPGVDPSEMELVTLRDGKVAVARSSVRGASGTYQWEAFAKAVRGEDVGPTISPEQIVAGLKVIRAMRLSQETGQPVQV